MWPFTYDTAVVFSLLLARTTGFFISGPLFARQSIPGQVRVLLGLATAVALFPATGFGAELPPELVGFSLAVAGEAFVGLILGFAASLPFYGIRMAGSLLGIQMGFGIVNVMTQRGERLSIVSRFYNLLAVLLFILMGGHHLLLRALALSLKTAPLGQVALGSGVASYLVGLSASMFVVALSVGGPLMAVLFLTDAAMGFVARTVPQMNIFIVGFPVKIGLGLLGIAVTLPFFVRTVDSLIRSSEQWLLAVLAGM